MEEADRILIHSLRQAGTAVPPEVQTLRAFTTELVVEAVVRCLRVINPDVGSGLSHLLPPAMSARFRLAMSLAQACMDLGYPLELGYQNFPIPVSLTFEICFFSWLSDYPAMPLRTQTSLQVTRLFSFGPLGAKSGTSWPCPGSHLSFELPRCSASRAQPSSSRSTPAGWFYLS